MDISYCRIEPGTPVLVTGATGFTGSWLVHKLVQAGVTVKAIARRSSDLSRLEGLPVEWHRGSVYDQDVVLRATKGAQYIFNVAAAFREAKIRNEEYYRVHVTGTQLLARAAVLNPGFRRFVQISSMGVHGHILKPPADENSPYAPGDAYQRTKLEAELWLRDFAGRNKMNHTIIRPAGIYGPGDRRLFKLFKMAAMPIFPVLGKGKCLYHLIHVDDLSNIILLSATDPAAQGEVFLAGDAEAIALTEMAQLVARTLGNRLRVVRLPAAPFFAAAAVCELACRPLGIEPPLYRRRVAFYTKDRCFDTTKLRRKLGYSTKYSNETGIVSTTKWYLEAGWLKPAR